MRLMVYRSVRALNGAANALYWKSSKRQISTHLKVVKHQKNKTISDGGITVDFSIIKVYTSN